MKYVAIGDSISAGFISNNPSDLPGKLKLKNDEKIVTGMSFPAFISWYINDMGHDALEEFRNFSATGTKVSNWIDLFSKIDNDENNILFGKNIDKIQLDLIKRIKSAEYISISLGANEYIDTAFEVASTHDVNKLIGSDFKVNIKGYNNIKKKVVSTFHKRYLPLFKELSDKIKALNPKAKIYFVGYTYPFASIPNPVEDKLKYFFGDIEPTTEAIEVVNEFISENAKKLGANYVEVELNKKWKDNAKWNYNKIDMSHPNILGYKTIGQILLETAIKNSDKQTIKRFETYKKNNNYNILHKTGLEIAHENSVVKSDISSRLVTLAGTYAELSVMFVKGFLNTNVISAILPVDKLKSFLFRNDNEIFLLIFRELVKNDTLGIIFDYFTKELASDDLDFDLEKINISGKTEYSLLVLISEIFNLEIFSTVKIKEELIEICASTLKNIVKNKNKELIANFGLAIKKMQELKISASALKLIYEFANLFISSPYGIKTFTKIVEEWMDNSNKYQTLSTFESLFVKILFNLREDEAFNKIITLLFKDMANNNTFIDLSSRIINEFLQTKTDTKGIDENKMLGTIRKLLKIVVENYDDYDIWKDIINVYNGFGNISNIAFTFNSLVPEIISDILFDVIHKKFVLNTHIVTSVLKMISQINKMSDDELSILYSVLIEMIEKYLFFNWEDSSLFDDATISDIKSKIGGNKLKISLLMLRAKKVYSKHVETIANVIESTKDDKYIKLLNLQYAITIIGVELMAIDNSLTKKLKLKKLTNKFLRSSFIKSVGKSFYSRNIDKLFLFDPVIEKYLTTDGKNKTKLKDKIEKIMKLLSDKNDGL